MNSITNFIAGVFLSLAALFGGNPQAPIQTLGAVTPVGGTTYYLSGSGVTSSQNTIQLTTFQTPDGRLLTMSMFGTIGYGALEPGSSKLEDVTFTGITQNANGTATLTGVSRGNDFVTPYAASTTLAKAHAGGVPFILTNTPGFYTQFMSLNNNATSTAIMVFSSTTPPRYDQMAAQATGNFISTTSELASVGYVNAVALVSAPNSSETVKGVTQLSTAAQAAASTASGSTGARLVVPSSMCSDTSSANVLCVITSAAGKIAQGFLDLTQAFTWTALHTFNGGITSNATTTLAGSNYKSNALVINTVAYQFPSTLGASSTVPVFDGVGIMRFLLPSSLLFASSSAQTNSTGSTTLASFIVPAGALGTSNNIVCTFYGTYSDTTTGHQWLDVSLGGTASTTLVWTQSSGSDKTVFSNAAIMTANGTGSQRTTIVSYDNTPSYNNTSNTTSIDSTLSQRFLIVGVTSNSSYPIGPVQISCVLNRVI